MEKAAEHQTSDCAYSQTMLGAPSAQRPTRGWFESFGRTLEILQPFKRAAGSMHMCGSQPYLAYAKGFDIHGYCGLTALIEVVVAAMQRNLRSQHQCRVSPFDG